MNLIKKRSLCVRTVLTISLGIVTMACILYRPTVSTEQHVQPMQLMQLMQPMRTTQLMQPMRTTQPMRTSTTATAAESHKSKPVMQKASRTLVEWTKLYKNMPLIDAHNHSATNQAYKWNLEMMWDPYGVDKVVIFGDVSKPSAVQTDKYAWEAYEQYPDRFIPFSSGINLLARSGLKTVKHNLEQGYFGIGELAIASTYSEVLGGSIWKTKHPMDGVLPDIYALCAQYKVPILMHIDPPEGMPMLKLEDAVKQNPETIFIFAHINAYNSPSKIRALMKKHSNVYADFYAGYTVFDPSSTYKLEDFVPLMKEFPERFLLSTDSGYGLVSEKKAIEAIYILIDMLDNRELALQITAGNMERLIRKQPATQTQLAALRQLESRTGKQYDLKKLNKVDAGRLLIEESKRHTREPLK
ncbi:amidohydrolase family protein [Paenibacillus sp. ACRRX]|uniref:amidohydrolase family protein n=1 Tax=Paenibacillus sp. ACRRX TaxID=2918206 RepID=UPI001EF726E3|nr:amidohydrolase family protein [Paenibacillus sp. ACRRX]